MSDMESKMQERYDALPILELEAALKAKDDEIERLNIDLRDTTLVLEAHRQTKERADKRIEELEVLAKYHALEMGCECRDCYQLREAEQYNHLSTAGERDE